MKRKKTKDFKFKQFAISGGFSGMPVSTDGVLLGAWTDLNTANAVLDIGTGTGLLALMCCQRSSNIAVDAIDIDRHALEAARSNFSASPWSQRITLHKGDVLQHPFDHCFDTIICNPPYFNSGEQSENSARATARHTNTLSHVSLLQRCWELLTQTGKASFVLPIVEGERFIDIALASGWHLQRQCSIKPTENKAVHRLLIQLGKQADPIQRQQLTIHAENQYSQAFVELTKDFYLKM